MRQRIKHVEPAKILQLYWLVSPLLIFAYLYLTALNQQTSFSALLSQASIAITFLNACVAFSQSYWLKALGGKQQRVFLFSAVIQQVASLNILGIALVVWTLRNGTKKATAAPLWFLISGIALNLLVAFVCALQLF